jgi:hypothetical protein
MSEAWKPVVGYEGIYEVSSLGRVRMLRRMRSDGRTYPERIARVKPLTTGYLNMSLYKGGKEVRAFVHRLVAEAFIPNPESKPCINHKDGNRSNNAVENLEWCTQSENIRHSFDTLGRARVNAGSFKKGYKPWNKKGVYLKEQKLI